MQPFASSSPWNVAIGSAAVYSHAKLFLPPHPLPESFFNDHDYFFVASKADPLVPVYGQGGWWEPATAATYCTLRKSSKVVAHLPFPRDVTCTAWGNNNGKIVTLSPICLMSVSLTPKVSLLQPSRC